MLPTIDKLKEEQIRTTTSLRTRKKSSPVFELPNYELQELKVKLQKSRIELEDKSKAVSGIQRNFDTVSSLLHQEKKDASRLREQVEKLRDKLDDQTIKAEVLQKEKQRLAEQVTSLKERVEQFAQKEKKVTEEVAKKIDTEALTLKSKEEELAKISKEMEKVCPQLETLKTKLKSSQLQSFGLKEELDSSQQRTKNLTEKNKQQEQSIQQLKKQAQIRGQQIDSLNNTVEQTLKTIHDKTDKIGLLQNQLEKTQGSLQSKIQQIASMKATADNHQSTVSALNKRIVQLEEDIDNRDNSIAQLRDVIEFKDAEIKAKVKALEDQAKFFENQGRENDEMHERMKIIGKIQEEVNASLSSCNASIRILTKELEVKAVRINELEAEALSSQLYYKEVDERVTAYQALSQNNKEKLKIVQQDDIFTVMRKYAQLEESYEKIKFKYDHEKVTRSNLEEQVERLRDDLHDQTQKLPQEFAFYKQRLHEKGMQVEGISSTVSQIIWANERLEAELADNRHTMESLRLELSEHRIQLLDYNKVREEGVQLREREKSYLNTLRENNEEHSRLLKEIDALKLKFMQKEDDLGKALSDLHNCKLQAENLRIIVEELNLTSLQALKLSLDKKALICNDALSRALIAMQALKKTAFQCPSCLGQYNDPVLLLPCCHSFCRGCDADYEFNCKECGTVFPVEKVQTNRVLAKADPIFRHALQAVEQASNIFIEQSVQPQPQGSKIEKRIYFEKAENASRLRLPKKGRK